MKIAIPCENGEVMQHFGHAKEFAIYAIEDIKPIEKETVTFDEVDHETVARGLKSRGVDLIICGEIGAGARSAVENAHMLLISGVTGEADEAPDELEQALFAMRDRLFAIVKPETPLSFDEKLDRLHLACCAMQSEYDDLLFPVEGEAEYAAEDGEDVPFSWSKMFWSEACLKALAERLAALEINKDSWRTLLGEVHARIPELLVRRADFLAYYKDKLYEYDELLEYFLYRHFMKTLADDVLIEKVQFALIGASFIQLLDIYRWLTDGELTHWEQICICKAYSREIEYNEDNTEAVARFLTMD